MHKYFIKVKPSDTLFFKEGFAFQKKASNCIDSLNRPYPSVFYGALFSAFLRQGMFAEINKKIKDIKDIKYKKDKESKEIKRMLQNDLSIALEDAFKIKGIYIYDEDKRKVYISAPLDIFQNDEKIAFGKYKDGLLYNPKSDSSKYKRVENKYISTSDLINYYSNLAFLNEMKIYNQSDFYCNYNKVGIEIDSSSNTAKDEHLYRISMVEFKKRTYSYLVEVELAEVITKPNEEKNKLNTDILRLGGESKLATIMWTKKYMKFIDEIKKYQNEKENMSDKIKIIFNTPAVIKDIDSKKKNYKYMITGKPNYIGGFDMASGQAKTMNKAIPAGSILVLESEKFRGKSLTEIIEILNDSENKLEKELLGDIKDKYRGFGQYIVMPFEGD